MIQIDPRISAIEGFNENHLWLVFKMVDIMFQYKKTKFKRKTLQNATGWGKNKIIKVSDELVNFGILKIDRNIRKSGGDGASTYTITTKFVGFLYNMEGESIEISDDESTVTRNQTPQDIVNLESEKPPVVVGDGYPKSNTAVSPFGTPILNSIKDYSLNTSSIEKPEKNYIENWRPNPTYHTAVKMACPDMTDQDFETELHQFKLKYSTTNPWPTNPDKTWLSFCQLSNSTYKSLHLTDMRVDKYHEKKVESISRVGTGYQKKEVVRPYPMDYESESDFYADCQRLRNEGNIVEPYAISVTAEERWKALASPQDQSIINLKSKINLSI